MNHSIFIPHTSAAENRNLHKGFGAICVYPLNFCASPLILTALSFQLSISNKQLYRKHLTVVYLQLLCLLQAQSPFSFMLQCSAQEGTHLLLEDLAVILKKYYLTFRSFLGMCSFLCSLKIQCELY